MSKQKALNEALSSLAEAYTKEDVKMGEEIAKGIIKVVEALIKE